MSSRKPKATKKNSKRFQIHVVYKKRQWLTEVDGENMPWPTKKRAVEDAVLVATSALRELGLKSELYIHGRDGKIQDKRTYGDDPRKIKG